MRITLKEKFLLFFVSLFLTLFLVYFNFFENISFALYDKLLTDQLKTKRANDNIVLITVDKKTVERYGNESFWTRSRYTSLINKLEKQKPKAIYFDYYFSEKTNPETVDWDLLESSSNLETSIVDDFATNYYKEMKKSDYFSSIDSNFMRTLRRYDNIVFPKLLFVDDDGITENTQIEPLPIFAKYSKVGYSNVSPDNDGNIRSLQFIKNEKPVSQILAEMYLSKEDNKLAGYSINFSKYLYEGNKLLINYFSPPYYRYDSIPFQNAYNGFFYDYKGNSISLKNKILIIGDYDESFGDMHKTPIGMGKLMSGMEIIANEVQTFIDHKFILKIEGLTYYLYIVLTVILVFLFFILVSNYIFGTLFILLILITGYFVDYRLFNKQIYFDYVGFFIAFFTPFLVINFYRLFIDIKEKNNTRKFFSKYVEKGIVDELIKSRKIPELSGVKKNITTLFTDIEGFTFLSEKLDPDEVISLLNNIFNRCNKVIFNNSGTLDKYIGDAIMAFWGAPKELEIGPQLACKTALEMQDEIRLFNSWNIDKNIPSLNFRIGISTGMVTVGSVGNDQYSDYTVIGDKVNLASRLEGINKYYGTNILICEQTYKEIKDKFYVREIDLIKVKGKNESVRIYEILGMKGDGRNYSTIKELISNHELGLKYYRQQKWSEALEFFNSNISKNQDKVAEVFKFRINYLKTNKPPVDWDSSFSFDVK